MGTKILLPLASLQAAASIPTPDLSQPGTDSGQGGTGAINKSGGQALSKPELPVPQLPGNLSTTALHPDMTCAGPFSY